MAALDMGALSIAPTQPVSQPLDMGEQGLQTTAPQPTTNESGGGLDMGDQGLTNPQTPKSGMDFWEAMGFAGRLGITDTVRGGAQIAGFKEDEMAAEQRKLDMILEEYGAPAYAAWVGGLFADPVAWALPISRVKHVINGVKMIKKGGFGTKLLSEAAIQAPAGAIVGGAGYVDEEADALIGDGKQTRLQNTLIGSVAGAAMGPAALAGSRKWASSRAGERAWEAVSKPQTSMGIVGGGLGGFAGYNSGINEHTEPLMGDLFSDEFVNSGAYAQWRNTLIGATMGATGGRKLGKARPHWFTPDFGIEESMLHARAKVKPSAKKIMGDNIDPLSKKIDDTLKTVPKAERAKVSEMLYRMVTDGPKAAKGITSGTDTEWSELVGKLAETNPGIMRTMRELRVDTLQAVNKLGKEMVDEGVLRKDVWLKNKNKYLHRIYNKDGEAQEVVSKAGYSMIGDELKARGIVKEVDEAGFRKLQQEAGPEDIWEKWDDTVKKSGKKEGMFKVRRDYNKAERLGMDENVDILDAFNATGKIMANDVAAARYLTSLSKMPNVSSANKLYNKAVRNFVGPKLPRNTRSLASQNPPKVEDWVEDHGKRLPQDKSYGSMRGRWVSKETAMDLESMAGGGTMNKVLNSNVVKSYQKANSVWKSTKTILNPAVHFNNAMSNVIMFDLGVTNMGASKWKVLAGAARELIGGKKSADYLKAEARGVFDVNLTTELAEGSLDGVAKSLSKSLGGTSNKAQNQAVAAMGHTTRILRAAKKWTYDPMAKAYAYEDNIFRLAMFKAEKKKLMERGVIESMADDQAAAKAREWFVDYSRQTPALQAMKTLPLPFFSYTYGIVPRLAESAIKHPVKIAKWASIGYLLNEAGAYSSKKSLEDIRETERLSAEVNNSHSMIGVPNRIRIPDALNPFDDDDAYLDITRAIPGGLPFGAKRGGVGQIKVLPDSMQPSFGALGGVMYPAMGIDQFRGTEIPEGEKLGAMARQFTPNIAGVPGTYAQNKIDLANADGYSKYKDKHTPGTAWGAAFGAKVSPSNDQKNRDRIGFTYQAKIDVVDQQIRKLKSKLVEGTINSEAYSKKMEAMRNKKQRIQRNMRKAKFGN